MREQLDLYAADAISAEALEDWLAAESWDMRRWVSIGLQRFVEAVQGIFIQYSDGKIVEEQLRAYLLQRREQLHRSAKATQEFKAAYEQIHQDLSEARKSLTRGFTLPVGCVPAV